ncbi:MAG TPA: response regulator [Spirochaetota bacterium]|nr:response regulator [Spirochaetota bacterium]HPN81791.1 response regulator [Spirochaetota bacterium]
MNKTILIVDDELYILDSMQRMLSALKYSILTASSGSEALDILASNDVNLIIVDIRMPEIDGKKIFTKVREVEPDIPVIIITGGDIQDGKAFADKHGAYGFLEKPIEIEKLKPLVDGALRKKTK